MTRSAVQWLAIFLLAVLGAVGCHFRPDASVPPPPPSREPRPLYADVVKDFRIYEAVYEGFGKDPDRWRTSRDGGELGWEWAHKAMAYLAIFEATGERKWLDRLMTDFDLVLANRDDRTATRDQVRDRVMPSWSTSTYSKGQRYAWMVHAGLITYPMVRIAWLIRRDPNLRPLYGPQAEVWVRRVAETVAAFDGSWRDGPQPSEGHYRDDYLRVPLPFNQQAAMGRTLVMMWLLTGDPAYRHKAARMAAYLRNRLRPDGDAWVWDYSPETSSPEDISHGGIEVDFAVLCHSLGLVFTDADMRRFVATFRRCFRPGQGFTRFVNGTGDFAWSWAMTRWLHLAYLDYDVADLYHRARGLQRGMQQPLSLAYLAEVSRGLPDATRGARPPPAAGRP